MKKIYQLLLLLLYLPAAGLAQKENNIWIFGDSIGMDFNSGVPVECTSSVHYFEGCATLSDASGKLLFYGAKNQVWDNTHSPMPNSFGILGNENGSTTQGTIIVPFIGDPDKYYLFTLSPFELFHTEQMYLRYSVVDMSLNSGKGDIVPGRKNIIVDSFTSEKMVTAVGTDCNFWLITHRWDTAEIHAFRIDASGISATPVISGFPSARYTKPPPGTYPGYMMGNIALSPDFSTLASNALPRSSSIELFDFNRATGAFSNRREITGAAAYACIFSPDGSKLYSSKDTKVVQYDLSLLPSLTSVIASETVVSNPGIYHAGMRCGPDGQIYVCARVSSNYQTSRIRKPNLKGAACDVEDDIGLFKSSPHIIGLGFGEPVLFTVPGDTFYRSRNIYGCDVPSLEYLAPAGYRQYRWEDGLSSAKRTFMTSDTLVLMMRGDCEVIYDTIRVRMGKADTITSARDTALCLVAPLTFSPPGEPALSYLWSDGDTSGKKIITAPGKVWLRRVMPPCSVRTDTFRISTLPTDTTRYIKDTTACFTDTISLSGQAGYTSYRWLGGDTGTVLRVSAAGTYVVTATNTITCKVRIDTFALDFIDFDIPLKATDSLCGEDSLELGAYIPGATYLWQDGSTDATYKARKPGIYTVTATVGNCSTSRSIQVSQVPFGVNLGNDLNICEAKDSVVLRVGVDQADYLWQNGETGPSFTVRESGQYSVTVRKDGCEASDSILVQFIKCDRCLGIPNTFTPNNDGINDAFKVLVQCPLESFEFRIYNRWGQEIFHSTDPADAWNGNYQGKPVEIDVYFYLLRIRIRDIDTELQLLKGDITLIR